MTAACTGSVAAGYLFNGTVTREGHGSIFVRGIGFTPEDSIRDALYGKITEEQLAVFTTEFLKTWNAKP